MGNKHIGGTWQEHTEEMLSDGRIADREIAEIDARVAIMRELTLARNEQNVSQRKLEALTGVRQPTISDMEAGKSSPSIDTVIRLLAPLGKTLAVVPIGHRQPVSSRLR
ncbi:MAG: helix-turn-helix domain-containing protein [Clostridiales Family XIII bacterium]|jgi:predicted XRE-type DNA-binding protein|nr:helix-turn-helix domain-containing protein [Clostridiales Family XIII bacterium]